MPLRDFYLITLSNLKPARKFCSTTTTPLSVVKGMWWQNSFETHSCYSQLNFGSTAIDSRDRGGSLRPIWDRRKQDFYHGGTQTTFTYSSKITTIIAKSTKFWHTHSLTILHCFLCQAPPVVLVLRLVAVRRDMVNLQGTKRQVCTSEQPWFSAELGDTSHTGDAFRPHPSLQ